MRFPYNPDVTACVGHYCDQQEGGSLPVYIGARYQRGSGLGSFLGGIFRTAIPFLKKGLLGIGKYGLERGLQLVGELERGKQFGDAARDQVQHAKQDFANKIRAQTGGRKSLKRDAEVTTYQLTPNKRQKKKAPTKKKKPSVKTKKKKTCCQGKQEEYYDVFDQD